MTTQKMSDAELEAAILARPKIKITREYMESRIQRTDYMRSGLTNTICTMTFDNGFVIHGISGCAHPDNYDETLGQQIAYRDAIDKAWPLFGFLLCEALHRDQQNITRELSKYTFNFQDLLEEIYNADSSNYPVEPKS